MLIVNIGQVFTGSMEQPTMAADSIRIEDGMIAAIGQGLTGPGPVIDAQGCAVMPGLIDNHVHPAFGDWTPRQNQLGWIESCVHGGVTSMVSAGEVHVPGRPRDPVGVRALSIAAQRCFENFRPLGAKVLAGAPVPERGMGRDDYFEMSRAGVRWLGEIGLGTVRDEDEVIRHAGWAREMGLNSMIHCGGPSIAGSNLMNAAVVCAADADIVAHINGGPTSLPSDQLARVIAGTTRAIEVVHNGNMNAARYVVSQMIERGLLDRLVVGTDSPAGSGVQPLGMLRMVVFLCGLMEIGKAIAAATGNVAKWRGLQGGVIGFGAPADLVFLDAPMGGGDTAIDRAMSWGNLPGIGMVIIDGQIRVPGRSRNTPPAIRAPQIIETGSVA